MSRATLAIYRTPIKFVSFLPGNEQGCYCDRVRQITGGPASVCAQRSKPVSAAGSEGFAGVTTAVPPALLIFSRLSRGAQFAKKRKHTCASGSIKRAERRSRGHDRGEKEAETAALLQVRMRLLRDWPEGR